MKAGSRSRASRSLMPESVGALIETLPAWVGLGAGGGAGFYMLKWFIEWLGGRVDKREASLESGVARLDAATQKLIENLQRRLDDVTDRLIVVEHELAECRTQHAETRAEAMRLQATVQGLGDAKQQAANIVAAERTMDRTVAAILKAGETK